MKMKKLLVVLALSLSLTGCASLETFQQVATATVPASVVIPAANAFDILKAAATNYGRYCIQQKMAPSICAADVRRVVIKAVRSGTGARNQMEASVATGQPALASIYNVLVSAVQSLQASTVVSAQFAGATQ